MPSSFTQWRSSATAAPVSCRGTVPSGEKRPGYLEVASASSSLMIRHTRAPTSGSAQ